MIFNYIEKSILRKINMIDILYGDSFVSIHSLAERLSCTIHTVKNDLYFLNEDLNIPLLELSSFFYKIDITKQRNKQKLYKKVYKQSLFLECLKFFLK